MDQFHHVSAAFLELDKGLVLMFSLTLLFWLIVFFFHVVSRLLIELLNLLKSNLLSRKFIPWYMKVSRGYRGNNQKNGCRNGQVYLPGGLSYNHLRCSQFHLESLKYQHLLSCFVKN